MSEPFELPLSRRVRELPLLRPTVPVEPVGPELLDGLRRALLGGETHYTERPGIRALRERIARRLGDSGLVSDRDADTVVVTAGEAEARFVVELAAPEATLTELGDSLFRDPLPRRRPVAPSSMVVGNLDALPGLRSFRVGFVSAPPSLAAAIRSWKQALSICTAAPSQRAALLLLEAGSSGEG